MNETPEPEDDIAALRARADTLEHQLREAMSTQQDRLLRAELKAAAVRAGMVDLDGLKLIDLSKVRLTESGEVEDGEAVMSRLRARKPWLFGQVSSSSAAVPPPSAPPQPRRVMDMSEAEWRAARAEMLRQR